MSDVTRIQKARILQNQQKPPESVHKVLETPGEPLNLSTQAFMEPRFGHDFSQVRVHADAEAAESAQAVDALAYTVGRDIVFGTGQYAPMMGEGQRLLAHELTHVVQQSRQSGDAQANLTLSEAGDVSEREAGKAADQIVSGDSPQSVQVQAEHALIQRDKTPQQTEDPALLQRRLAAVARLRKSASLIQGALAGGLRWSIEYSRPKVKGNRIGLGGESGVIESYTNRQKRLMTLFDDLVQFTAVLESGPVPVDWLDPKVKMTAGTFEGASTPAIEEDFSLNGPDWQEPLRFFAKWQLAQGQNSGILTINLLYIPDPPLPTPQPELPRVAKKQGYDNGIETETRIIVPDPDNKPFEYEVLGAAPHGPPGEYLRQIFRVWVERGEKYYYLHKGWKIYLPERPAPPSFNPRR